MPGTILRHNLSVSDPLGHFSSQWAAHTAARTEGTFTDLLLVPGLGEGYREVLVHQAVLLPLLPFLAGLTLEPMARWREVPAVLLPDVDLATIQRLVELIYTGSCQILCIQHKTEVIELMNLLGLHIPPQRLFVEEQEVSVMGGNATIRGLAIVRVKKEEIPEYDDLAAPLSDPSILQGDSSPKVPHGHYFRTPPSSLQPCHICGKLFTFQSNLSRHLKKHEDNNSKMSKKKQEPHLREVHCPVCPRKFKYQANLSVHLQTHSEDKPFSCTFCSQNFRHRGHLARHKRIKHPEQVNEEKITLEPLLKRQDSVHKTSASRKTKLCLYSNDKYSCNLCDFVADNERHLSFHMMVRHKVGDLIDDIGVKSEEKSPPFGQMGGEGLGNDIVECKTATLTNESSMKIKVNYYQHEESIRIRDLDSEVKETIERCEAEPDSTVQLDDSS
jgi:hypothetical protein